LALFTDVTRDQAITDSETRYLYGMNDALPRQRGLPSGAGAIGIRRQATLHAGSGFTALDCCG
jgi:hypothetical protein